MPTAYVLYRTVDFDLVSTPPLNFFYNHLLFLQETPSDTYLKP